jgi:hypothetical protein
MREKERAVGVEYELETIARGNVCGDNQMAAATKEVCTRVAESMNLEVKVIAEKYFAAKYTSIPHGCYYKPYGSKGAAIFWMEKGEHFEFNIRYSGNFETNSKFIQMVCIPRGWTNTKNKALALENAQLMRQIEQAISSGESDESDEHDHHHNDHTHEEHKDHDHVEAQTYQAPTLKNVDFKRITSGFALVGISAVAYSLIKFGCSMNKQYEQIVSFEEI